MSGLIIRLPSGFTEDAHMDLYQLGHYRPDGTWEVLSYAEEVADLEDTLNYINGGTGQRKRGNKS